jgi:hypothetical protein
LVSAIVTQCSLYGLLPGHFSEDAQLGAGALPGRHSILAWRAVRKQW